MMSVEKMTMRWEKVHQRSGGAGPGVRWGHTCNAVRHGKLLYVFGGCGRDRRQTNRVHVFDTANMVWSEPVIRGTPPAPRDSHSCTTVGDNLFIFGGTDGHRPLSDLHILDTASNSWILPSVRGDSPEPREGHSAALVDKRLFIFGGCGKFENSEIYYDDLYILNTETFTWQRVFPSGTPPSKRDSHTCSSWKNKIIVIGGEDSCNYYLSDVHILDADTLVWSKLNITGQLLPPRGGHTAVCFESNLFVFGGFSDEQNLYDDIYMLELESGAWSKIIAHGEGPSGRFSVAGESLYPHMKGVLVFLGGCNRSLDALDDMYFLHTGLYEENRDQKRIEKLSLRKQLKLKCQEQQGSAAYEKSPLGADNDTTIYQPMPISSYMPSGKQNFYLNECPNPTGKKTFQAKVTKSFADGYIVETVIDGRPLRGVLFSNRSSSTIEMNDSMRRADPSVKANGASLNVDQNTTLEGGNSLKHHEKTVEQANDILKEKKMTSTSSLPVAETRGEAPSTMREVSIAPLSVSALFDDDSIERKEPAIAPVAETRGEAPSKMREVSIAPLSVSALFNVVERKEPAIAPVAETRGEAPSTMREVCTAPLTVSALFDDIIERKEPAIADLFYSHEEMHGTTLQPPTFSDPAAESNTIHDFQTKTT